MWVGFTVTKGNVSFDMIWKVVVVVSSYFDKIVWLSRIEWLVCVCRDGTGKT